MDDPDILQYIKNKLPENIEEGTKDTDKDYYPREKNEKFNFGKLSIMQQLAYTKMKPNLSFEEIKKFYSIYKWDNLKRRFIYRLPKEVRDIVKEVIQNIFEDSNSIQQQIDTLEKRKENLQNNKSQVQSAIERLQNQIESTKKSRMEPLNKQLSDLDKQLTTQRENLSRTRETEQRSNQNK